MPTFSDASQPGNEDRCFVLEDVPEDDFFVTALAPVIGSRAMAHHVVLFTGRESALTDAHKGAQGFDSIDGQEWQVVSNIVGAWAPGSLPIALPEGVGIKFNGGQPLVMQMHYFDPGTQAEGESDRSGYAFHITDSVETEACFDFWGVQIFTIPAGDKAYTKAGDDGISRDLTPHALLPHMHVPGDSYEMTATAPDGTEDCLVEGKYDFNNQIQYEYREPHKLAGGTSVDFSCTWNNSTSNPDLIHDPPVDTRYGERTDEEMCFFFGLVSTDQGLCGIGGHSARCSGASRYREV